MRKPAAASVEPYRAQQWYLDQDRAWDFWRRPPALPAVKVAVVDTGLDMSHPEFAGRVAAGKSFVGGRWSSDTDGHGTFVAGLIAADPANGVGIAGLAPNVSLLVAKVSEPDGVSLDAEVRAIVWAVRQGARVINLSIGGVRDPDDSGADRFSGPERDAIAFARSRGVVVVAAVGNGTDSPVMPWRFANWPAAFPHVIGVAALRRDGSVPAFSNRDPFYVDLAAPGQDVISTIPRGLVDPDGRLRRAVCRRAGPRCGAPRRARRSPAPQVSAAAALLIGADLAHAGPGRLAARALGGRRDAGPLREVRRGPRRAHGLGPARRARRARAAEERRRSSACGRARAQRRRGAGGAPVRAAADDRRHARPLGRPDRRVRDPASARTDAPRRAHERAPASAAAALGAGHGHRRARHALERRARRRARPAGLPRAGRGHVLPRAARRPGDPERQAYELAVSTQRASG